MIFEDKVSKKQETLINLAIELSDNKADKIYIYGSYEANIISFNCFFGKRNRLYTINDLPKIGVTQISNERMFSFLKFGSEDFKELLDLFKKDGKKLPTQIKLVYDARANSAKAYYSYELFYSNLDTVTPEEIFLEWYEEVKKEVEGN